MEELLWHQYLRSINVDEVIPPETFHLEDAEQETRDSSSHGWLPEPQPH